MIATKPDKNALKLIKRLIWNKINNTITPFSAIFILEYAFKKIALF